MGVKESTLVYQAKQITDPNQLLMRAKLGIDERSTEARRLTHIRGEWKDAGLFAEQEDGIASPEVFTTTQLVKSEILPNGDRVEEYATAAVATSTDYGTESNQSTQNTVTVFAMINYKYTVSDNAELIRFGIQNTKHRADSTTSAKVTSMDLYSEIADTAPRASNSKTINSPVTGTWYQLNSPSSQTYDKMVTTLYAVTTAHTNTGATPEVSCVIDCKWFEPWN